MADNLSSDFRQAMPFGDLPKSDIGEYNKFLTKALDIARNDDDPYFYFKKHMLGFATEMMDVMKESEAYKNADSMTRLLESDIRTLKDEFYNSKESRPDYCPPSL